MNRIRCVQTRVLYFLALTDIMSEKDIARQVLRGYIDREIDLENQLKEM